MVEEPGDDCQMQKQVTLLFLASLCGFAQNITVQNSSFEAATLPLYGGYGSFNNVVANSNLATLNGSVSNWTGNATVQNAAAGVLAPIARGPNWTTHWFTGNNVAYLQISNAGTVSLSQTLGTRLENNTMYMLSTMVGRRASTPRFNYSIQLWAGSTLLASASHLALADNSFGRDTLSYSTGPDNTKAGQAIMIVLSSAGTADGTLTEAYFDQVSLTAKAVFAISGVTSATAFGGGPSTAPGSFVEIYGSNLATNTRNWGGSDFGGGDAPTSLDGTSVTIGGQKAFVSYISPNQVNALVPSNIPTGQQGVAVTNALGVTSAFTITVNAVEPGLLATSNFRVKGTQYAVALNPDGTYALPVGAIDGLASHPAAAGETLVFYGMGFGPVTPAIPAGQLVGQPNALTNTFQMFIGGMAATAAYSGLAPNYTGLYQFNIVVPDVGSGSAVPVTFALGGTNGTQTLYIAVQD
jgi:uncharacterized protein (TIGR03437 family)